MAWTQPKTWTNEPLVAADLNTHLRDNLNALKDSPSYSYQSASSYSTTSTTPVLVDSSNMNETITLESAGNVLLGFNGTVTNTGGNLVYFALQRNGANILQSMVNSSAGGIYENVAMEILLENLPAGDHTFAVKWWVQANTGALSAGKNQFYIQGV